MESPLQSGDPRAICHTPNGHTRSCTHIPHPSLSVHWVQEDSQIGFDTHRELALAYSMLINRIYKGQPRFKYQTMALGRCITTDQGAGLGSRDWSSLRRQSLFSMRAAATPFPGRGPQGRTAPGCQSGCGKRPSRGPRTVCTNTPGCVLAREEARWLVPGAGSSGGGHCSQEGLQSHITNRNSSYRFISGTTSKRTCAERGGGAPTSKAKPLPKG